ncbi:MAG: DNA translocase FtsK [Candidatus Niyogibacteria bacterium]|nr:DNA translocase FtsK [Candidatus Niyogibacteria bacterium]
MLFSALGIFDVVLGSKTAGWAGYIVSMPLLKLFDYWAALVILFSFFIVSVVLMLNISLKPRLKTEEDEEEEETEPPVFAPESPESGWGGIKEAAEALKREILSKTKEKEIARAEEEFDEPEAAEKEETENGFMPSPFRFGPRASKSLAASPEFKSPPLDLLEDDRGKPSSGDIKANANIIKRTLQNFDIMVEMGEVNIGPSITQYTLRPAEGVKLSKITGLHNDLALALAAHPIRIEAPIPGKSLIGIEIPNKTIALVGLRSVLGQEDYQVSKTPLLLGLGRDVSGRVSFADLGKMPHLMIAGATGSGKSVAIHAIMMSLLYRNSPERLRFLLIDPKRVELTAYSGIPHILTPVITDAKKSILSLKWAVGEMERRYEFLAKAKVRDINSYQGSKESEENPMPYIVIVIDELADIMSVYPRELEASVVRLAQMSRAVGIHLIVSTQRPSVEVITGLIKANITSRMAFQVASQIDSRTILDMSGSEKLLGNGDMLYLSGDTSKPRRIQGAFVSETEVRKVTQYLESEYTGAGFEPLSLEPESGGGTIFDSLSADEDVDDELYKEAESLVIEAGKASASYLQRRLRVGYARAARLLDVLESKGVIGPGDGAKPREVLVKKEDGSESKPEDDESEDGAFFESFK